MKKITYIIGMTILALGFGLSACDKVEAPYREKAVVIEGSRNAVIFEFTGHKCPNCPPAAEEAHQLKEAYGDRLSIVAIHAGGFANPDTHFPLDLRSEAGDQINKDLKVQAYPSGTVSMSIDPATDNVLTNYGNWGNLALQQLDAEGLAEIKMEATSDIASKKINANLEIVFNSKAKDDYKIGLMITEDGIIGRQKDAGKIIEEYEFNHVLRRAVSDIYGDPIYSTDAPIPNQTYAISFNDIVIDDSWNMDKLNLLAYIIKDDADIQNRQIIQVKEIHLEN